MRLTGSAQEQRTKPLCLFLPPRRKILPVRCFSPLSCVSAFLLLPFLPFLPFAARHQKWVVKSPSLNSPQRMRRRWLVLDEFAKYAFFGLKRKRRNFERSVLKYVSIKIPALTHSGRKSRVCVNAADRLLPPSTQSLSPSPTAESQAAATARPTYRSK